MPPWKRKGNSPFDLILMDVQMPEMDGLEATALIREKEKTTGEHIPIIALTAHAMKGDREVCLEAGMDGYVSKPLKADELLSVMRELIADRMETGPIAAQPDVEKGDVFNREQALASVDGDMDLFREIVGLFSEEYPKHHGGDSRRHRGGGCPQAEPCRPCAQGFGRQFRRARRL